MSIDHRTKMYLAIAFGVTWIGWLGAYGLSIMMDYTLNTDMTIFDLSKSFGVNMAFFIQLLFSLAVYGPLLGFVAVKGYKGLLKADSNTPAFRHYMLIVPLVSVLPVFVLSMRFGQYTPQGKPLATLIFSVLVYFISNLLTSGTEEFGWRGYLYPELKRRNKTFWDAAWKGGLIWALWHYPLMFFLYLPHGFAVLIPSLIGFTASIVAMSYISNFIYEKSRSIWAVVVLHALNNTGSYLIMLLFPDTPFSILTSIMFWAIVAYIDKKHKID